MIGALFGTLMFALFTAIIVADARLLWPLDAAEVRKRYSDQWRYSLLRRARIATPALILPLGSVTFLGIIAVVTSSSVFVIGVGVMVFASLILVTFVMATGRPRALVLPAFRAPEAFRLATRD